MLVLSVIWDLIATFSCPFYSEKANESFFVKSLDFQKIFAKSQGKMQSRCYGNFE